MDNPLSRTIDEGRSAFGTGVRAVQAVGYQGLSLAVGVGTYNLAGYAQNTEPGQDVRDLAESHGANVLERGSAYLPGLNNPDQFAEAAVNGVTAAIAMAVVDKSLRRIARAA